MNKQTLKKIKLLALNKPTEYRNIRLSTFPYILDNKDTAKIYDAKIYGNSLGLGNLITDNTDANYGKYEIKLNFDTVNRLQISDIGEFASTNTEIENGYRLTIRDSSISVIVAYFSFNYTEFMGKTVKLSFKSKISSQSMIARVLVCQTRGESYVAEIFNNSHLVDGYHSFTFQMPNVLSQNANSIKIYFYLNYLGVISVGDYVDYTEISLTENIDLERYQDYSAQKSLRVYIDNPLFADDNIADYIDLKAQKVYRYFSSMGELLETPIMENLNKKYYINLQKEYSVISCEEGNVPNNIMIRLKN